MKQDVFYCSTLSTESGEQSIGTASIAESWLLLDYRSPWGVKAFQESSIAEDVKRHLSGSLKSVPGSRILLIKQEQSTDPLSLFVVRSLEMDSSLVKYEFSHYEQLMDLDLAAALRGHPSGGAKVWNEPLFLICTHGKRDKCCAKFGFSIYKTIRDFAGNSSVWQSSHVGGDRFAANVVCFPDGLFYAHVTEETAPQIVSSYREGKMLLNNLRGRSCYGRAIQVAEFFVRLKSGLRGIRDLKFLEYEAIKSNDFRVSFRSQDDGATHEVYITSKLSEFQNRLTCHSEEERKVVQYVLRDYQRVAG